MRKIFDFFFSGLFWILFALSFFFWTSVLAIVGLFSDGKPLEWVGVGLCKTNLFIGGISLKRMGKEKVTKKQYIVMMNHLNLFDPFVLYSSFPGRVVAFQEEDHFKWPLYGWIMKKQGHLPITRSNPRKALRDLKKGIEFLKEKQDFSIIIFPEGTRSETGKLGAFKKGAFLLAIDSGLEILPVVQLGGYEVKKKSHWRISPGKMELYFLDPISTEGYNRKNVTELMEKTRSIFLDYVEE
ncbi:MAG: 1-acyl-sn-glycerol-3-phosphate acyltransferase [bacterium]|nr:1-acyl-sn-glycerol-3-phosphate acyltransferase [bacterium]